MSLREWLIAIGALVIIAIVIDGLRRVRRARKDSMAISSGMGADDIEDSPLDGDYNPELPNGGARPISRDTLEERGYVTSAANPSHAEPSGSQADARGAGPGAGRKPATSGEAPQAPSQPAQDAEHRSTPEVEAEPEPVPEPEPPLTAVREDEPVAPAAPEPPTVTTEVEENTATRRQPATPRRKDTPLAGANRPPAEEVIVINVLARSDQAFSGVALKKLFEACGLEHGDLDIYHRHETTDPTSPVQFSVANAVEPGTFRPGDMATLQTPGISFFMSLPGPGKPLQAFDFMLETAQAVVRNLGGELKDERRSVMTPQTIEHCRQRIREYERKSRSRRA